MPAVDGPPAGAVHALPSHRQPGPGQQGQGRPDSGQPRPRRRGILDHGPAPSSTLNDTGGHEVQLSSVQQEAINARPYIRRLEQSPPPGPNWAKIITVGTLLVLIAGGVWFVSQLRSGDGGEASAFGQPGGPIVNPTVDELATATVQLLGLDANDEPMCSGSGTFVSTDGLILTNAHVVTNDVLCSFSSVGVAVTDDAGRPPQLLYRADVLVTDLEADLAVLRVSESLNPEEPFPSAFPALALGDSDALGIGDDVRILGYPEIGGETITFTNGSVSGFTAQAGIGDRALIKTDATIAGGNSGGAAVYTDGRLIGIPTKARASESGPAVDCRPLADTNGDGEVDAKDNCVPIGGFLNGIRPINLANDLIDEAHQAPARPVEQARPVVEVDPASIAMTRPRFSLGETDNNPANVVVTATGGVNELCLFVDWAGIPNGVEWDGIWWFNGEPVNAYSLVEQLWEFGEEGNNFWLCAIDLEEGLASGLYELGFFINGELIFAEGLVLTDDPTPVLASMWENLTDVEICGLAVNPDGSGQVGLNELASGQTLPPGEMVTLQLPAGGVVVEAVDCNGNIIADSGGVLMIEENHPYAIELPGQTQNDDGIGDEGDG